MIDNIDAYLSWFEGVNRRAMRDVAILPPGASAWRPPVGDGENGWTIGEIVGHMASARIYFANAYRGAGWITDIWPAEMSDRSAWLPALQESAARFVSMLQGTPADWLRRKIELIGSEAGSVQVSGWRVLM